MSVRVWGVWLVVAISLACGGVPSAASRAGGAGSEVLLGAPSEELAAVPAVMALPVGASGVRWVRWVRAQDDGAVWLGVWLEASEVAIEAAYGSGAPVREPLVLPGIVAGALLPEVLSAPTLQADARGGVVVPARAELSAEGVVRGWGGVRIVTIGSGVLLIATR